MNDRNRIEIHHSLSGYESGHRLLATSKSLTASGKRMVLQLSDRSVDVLNIPSDGYLTGYPLAEDNVYVLARTWSAPEMPRPGCVWTHSLLISYTDLAEIEDPVRLLRLFRRPDTKQISERFHEPLLFERSNIYPPHKVDRRLATTLLLRLYTTPDAQVIVPATEFRNAETTLLSIWGQQWPRLRRNFRFCTLTEKSRSNQEHEFDVQLTMNSRSAPHLVDISGDGSSDEEWLRASLNDLEFPNTGLRQFLKRAGGDMTKGRMRFAELCRLYMEGVDQGSVPAIEKCLDYVANRLPSNEGALLRRSTVRNALKVTPDLSQDSLVTILPLAGEELHQLNKKSLSELASRYWAIDPSIMVNPDTPKQLTVLSDELIRSLPSKKALSSLKCTEHVALKVLSLRPDLLEDHEVWLSEYSDIATESLSSAKSHLRPRKVISAIIAAGRADLAEQVCSVFSPEVVFEEAVRHSDDDNGVAYKFAKKAFSSGIDRETAVISALTNEDLVLTKKIIFLLAESVSPQLSVPSSKRPADPWAACWKQAAGKLDKPKTDSVMIFMALRAFTKSGDGAASLLEVSCDPILDRISTGDMSYDKRSNLQRHLASGDWFDWSFEGRFFRTIANLAVSSKLTKAQLDALTTHDHRLSKIVKAIEVTRSGRSYLKSINLRY